MKEKMNALDEKFKKDELKFVQIKNKDLVCRTCRKKFDDTDMPCNTSKCEAYRIKPTEVLDGGMCFEYESQE